MATPPSASRDAVRATVPYMIELTEKVLFGDVWERPNLSKRDRSLIVCATLIATYRPEQLVGHLQRALDKFAASKFWQLFCNFTFNRFQDFHGSSIWMK